jgi:hypothetical protein
MVVNTVAEMGIGLNGMRVNTASIVGNNDTNNETKAMLPVA